MRKPIICQHNIVGRKNCNECYSIYKRNQKLKQLNNNYDKIKQYNVNYTRQNREQYRNYLKKRRQEIKQREITKEKNSYTLLEAGILLKRDAKSILKLIKSGDLEADKKPRRSKFYYSIRAESLQRIINEKQNILKSILDKIDNDRIYSIKECADILGVKEPSIYYSINKGKIKSIGKSSKNCDLIKGHDLIEYIKTAKIRGLL